VQPAPQQAAPKPEAAKPAVVATTQPAATPATNADNDAKAQAVAAIESWAKAWSTKDVKGYLASYAPDFEVPGGESRSGWEKQRSERIERPKSIEVDVKVVKANVSGNEATVTIRQAYRSDTLKSNTTKTMKLVKHGDRWLIKQERSGG
jgi:ketosteroid isomerase-like protein